MTNTITKNTAQATTQINAFYEAISKSLNAKLAAHIKAFISWTHEDRGMNELAVIQVIEQFEPEEFVNYANDVANHGISGGFSGFTYYTETVAFYESNKDLIIEQIKEDRDSFDTDISIVEFIATFGVMKSNDIDIDMVGEFLYSDKCISDYEDDKAGDYTQFANGIAWVAAETVCNAYSDYTCDHGAYE